MQRNGEFGSAVRPATAFAHANEYSMVPDGKGRYKRDYHFLLAEEDTLYDSLEHFTKEGPQAQFYILGDTNHDNIAIVSMLRDRRTMELFAARGCALAFIEWHESIQPHVEAYRSGALDKNGFVHLATEQVMKDIAAVSTGAIPARMRNDMARTHHALAARIRDAAKAGLELVCIDRREGSSFVNGKAVLDAKARFAADAGLARRIKSVAGDRRALIIYGAGHGAYRGTLDDCLGADNLGVDNVVRLNVHANQRQYRCSTIYNKCHIDNQPRYLYLVEEDRVIAAPDNYGQRIDIDQDPTQRALDPEVQALHERRARQEQEYWRRHQHVHEHAHRSSGFYMTDINEINTSTFRSDAELSPELKAACERIKLFPL